MRLYVDNNNSGTFDENEEVIEGQTVRVVKSSGQVLELNNQTLITQIQPYKHYQFVINEANIKNPMLSPNVEAFSVVTDPNQTKKIDIPLYITGIIEGQAIRIKNGTPDPIAGLRVIIKQVNGDYESSVTTFYDGSYYAMEIPPGTYSLEIDPNQLSFLNVNSSPSEHFIEVKATAEGDFIEGLNFVLTPSE